MDASVAPETAPRPDRARGVRRARARASRPRSARSSSASRSSSGTPSSGCSPTATCSSRASPAWARRCSSGRSRDVIDCTFNRIQFTPDLMPADITGTNILVEEGGARVFQFQPGPIFANLVLADEINRATPEDPVGAARGDAGAPGHGRAQPVHARPAVLRPGHPEPARDGGHVPAPRGAARPVPAQGRWSRSRPRRTWSRSSTGRPARTRRPREGRPTAAEIVEMQRLARAVPIAPAHHGVRRLAPGGDPPRQPPRAGAGPPVRPLRRLAARRPGPGRPPARSCALMDGRFNVSDRRRPGRRPAGPPPPRDPELRGRGRGHHDRGRRPRDPRRGGAARRRVADPAPAR